MQIIICTNELLPTDDADRDLTFTLNSINHSVSTEKQMQKRKENKTESIFIAFCQSGIQME